MDHYQKVSLQRMTHRIPLMGKEVKVTKPEVLADKEVKGLDLKWL